MEELWRKGEKETGGDCACRIKREAGARQGRPGLCGGIKRGVAGREKRSERDRRGEREEKKMVSWDG